MIVPTVNKEIWSQLPQAALRADLRAVYMHRALTKAAIAVVELVNEMLPHPGVQDCVRRSTDAIAQLGHASREMSFRRRSSLKPFVNKTVARMCDESSGVPITDKLFGDNLAASIREMKQNLDRLDASVVVGLNNEKRGRFFHKGNRAFF